MNDQKIKADNGKPKLTLVPRQIIFDIARVREYGNEKYPEGGPDNWKKVDKQRYRDAAFRHFMAYLDDPDGVDAESGLPHLWHLACNVAFLCEMEKYMTADEFFEALTKEQPSCQNCRHIGSEVCCECSCFSHFDNGRR